MNCVYCTDPLEPGETSYHFNGVCDREADAEAEAETWIEDRFLDQIAPDWRNR